MEEIRALIISLGKRHISSRDYHKDMNPAADPEEDTSGRPHSNQVAIITKEGVHIHMKYIEQFNRSDVDPVRDIIERMTHQHARSKRMILARPVKRSWHILRTFQREPNDQPITERNVLYNSEASRIVLGQNTVAPCRRVKSYSYNKDLDDNAYERRCQQLQVECTMLLKWLPVKLVHIQCSLCLPMVWIILYQRLCQLLQQCLTPIRDFLVQLLIQFHSLFLHLQR